MFPQVKETATKPTLTGDWETIKQIFTDAWTAISTTVTTVLTSISEFLSTMWSTITTGVSTAWTNITTAISTAATNIWTAVTTAFTNMWNAITTTVENIKNTIVNGFQQAIAYITSLPAQAFNWGRDIIQNIVNGIRSMISSVGELKHVDYINVKCDEHIEISVSANAALTNIHDI